MVLVALAWIYVVLMVALVEATSAQGTVLGALFTLLFWGVLPLGIVLYLMTSSARRKRRHSHDAVAISTNTDAAEPSASQPLLSVAPPQSSDD